MWIKYLIVFSLISLLIITILWIDNRAGSNSLFRGFTQLKFPNNEKIYRVRNIFIYPVPIILFYLTTHIIAPVLAQNTLTLFSSITLLVSLSFSFLLIRLLLFGIFIHFFRVEEMKKNSPEEFWVKNWFFIGLILLIMLLPEIQLGFSTETFTRSDFTNLSQSIKFDYLSAHFVILLAMAGGFSVALLVDRTRQPDNP